MKQDYLWDKKGSDPEIEGLEDLLSGFAYTETPPPIVRQEASIPFFRRFFDLRILVPAAVAVVVLALFAVPRMFWTEAPQTRDGVATVPHTIVPPKEPDQFVPLKATQPPVKELDRPMPIHAAYRTATRKPVRRSAPELTKEEKYAYGQLMLALSITSSKLKIVQDAANGNENSDSPKTRDR